MPTIPPWIAINPKDFLAASEAGGQLGSKIAQMRTEANMNTERLASSERENSARIAAQNAASAAARAQAASDSDAARAMRQFEFSQKMGQDQATLDQAKLAESDRNALGLKTLNLGESRLDLEGKKQDAATAELARKAKLPLYRTVENQLLKVDPETGEATSLYTAPFRPTTGSILEQFLNQNTGGSATNSIPAIRPSGPSSSGPKVLTPDLANQYLYKFGGDRAKAETAAKQDGFAW